MRACRGADETVYCLVRMAYHDETSLKQAISHSSKFPGSVPATELSVEFAKQGERNLGVSFFLAWVDADLGKAEESKGCDCWVERGGRGDVKIDQLTMQSLIHVHI